MKLKHTTILIILLVFQALSINAQQTFSSGYIVKLNGDTLSGLIMHQQGKTIYQKCTFKRFDIAIPQTYLPGEILAYGFRNANHYESKFFEKKSRFFERHIKGEISLYTLGSRIFIEKGNTFVELTKGSIKSNDPELHNKYPNHHSLLAHLTKDNNAYQIPDNIELSKDPILTEIEKYNKGTNKPFKVYNQLASKEIATKEQLLVTKKTHHWGVISSFNTNKATLSTTLTAYNHPYVANYQNRNISMGAFYSYSFKRTTKDISIQVEAQYKSTDNSFYLLAEESYPTTKNNHIDISSGLKYISIPVTFKYGLPLKHFTPYAGLGISFNLPIAAKYNGSFEEEKPSEVITYNLKTDKLEHTISFTNLHLCLGIKTQVTRRINAFIEARTGSFITQDYFEFDRHMSPPKVTLDQRLSSLSLSVGLGF